MQVTWKCSRTPDELDVQLCNCTDEKAIRQEKLYVNSEGDVIKREPVGSSGWEDLRHSSFSPLIDLCNIVCTKHQKEIQIRQQEERTEKERERIFAEGEIKNDWIVYGEDSDGEYSYDKNNILKKVNPDITRVYVLTRLSFDYRKRLIKRCSDNNLSCDRVKYTIQIVELDCTNKTSKVILTHFYDEKGGSPFLKTGGQKNSVKINSGSSEEKLLNILCNK